jgi:hypothetical protein
MISSLLRCRNREGDGRETDRGVVAQVFEREDSVTVLAFAKREFVDNGKEGVK